MDDEMCDCQTCFGQGVIFLKKRGMYVLGNEQNYTQIFQSNFGVERLFVKPLRLLLDQLLP